MRIGQPKAVTFDRDAQAWMRPELQNASDVMDVLQREEVHITVEPVITREKIVESLMLAIMRIAVARGVGIFKAQPGLGPGIRKGVPALSDDHISPLIQAFGRSSGARIAKVP